jgi:hypothetical protein
MPATGGLLFRKKNAAFRRTTGAGFHCSGVGRADRKEVMNLSAEDRSFDHRIDEIWQHQIGHRPQLISRRWASRDIHTVATEFLHQSPDLRPIALDLLSDLRAAHNHGCIVHEQAHNA